MHIRQILAFAVASFAALSLVACGADSGTPGTSEAPTKPLRVMADVIPHSELIKEAEKLGLLGDVKVEITEISAQVDANQLVNEGDLDANFFQHVPYLDDWNANHAGADLVPVATVHVEPLGLYSKKVDDLKDVPENAVIAIPSDATNQARALFLLEDAGLLALDVDRTDADLDYSQVTPKNVKTNEKNISFVEIDRPQLAASLDDPKVNLSIINGNYALEANLVPSEDALFLETAADNPYANVLVVKETMKDDPRVVALAKALESDELAKFITDNYQGSVIPAVR